MELNYWQQAFVFAMGFWTLTCVGLGFFVGRRAKWEEQKDVEPKRILGDGGVRRLVVPTGDGVGFRDREEPVELVAD